MFPRVCGCGRVVQPGQRCSCKPVARRPDTRANAGARGYGADWQRLRAEHLKRQPLCVRCGEPARVVDHKISVRRAPHRRLDPANLQSLCTGCHSGWKQSAERRGLFD